jgi:hypothetical protein
MTETVENVTAEEKPVLTFEDRNYVVDELSDVAKYIISQLQDLDTQAGQMKAKLDQVEVARRGFTDLLRAELNPVDEPREDSPVVEG